MCIICEGWSRNTAKQKEAERMIFLIGGAFHTGKTLLAHRPGDGRNRH